MGDIAGERSHLFCHSFLVLSLISRPYYTSVFDVRIRSRVEDKSVAMLKPGLHIVPLQAKSHSRTVTQ
jgi:hypothetical protein